jgi:hypothetical protein
MKYLLIGEIIYIIAMVIDLIKYKDKSLFMNGKDEDLVDYLFGLIITSGLYILAWPIMTVCNIIYIVNDLKESM